MDDFVRDKLTEWGLTEWIEKFEAEGVDEESLYCLENDDIDKLLPKVGPKAKFKRKLKVLKEEQNPVNQETIDSSAQCHQVHEEAADSSQVSPSTSNTSGKAKRKLDLQGECSTWQSPTRKQRSGTTWASYTEGIILSDVKNIMSCVQKRLPNQENKLNKFLKVKICDLKTDKRELIGVFGRTGAGKSSLINAVIGEKNLLPSGNISACTSVMIQVEANMHSPKYEAEIEFITKEEWQDELWSSINFLSDNANLGNDQEDDSDYRDTVDKLSALYGEEEWKNKSSENLMDSKYFREVHEFLHHRTKTLTCESAKELSAKLVKYTRTDSDVKDVKRCYWPLVKCVTVRVPNNDLLQHVTLVDLPGNGDRNKSRDRMWKGVVGSCSTVWIVTDINRAVAEKEPWEILESAGSLMGNGGECQQIHFICTKTDVIGDSDDHSAAGVRAHIFKINMQAKEILNKEFRLNKIKKHFSDDCFKVFTVSSKEFLKKKLLEPEETEIPKLQEFLQSLNDCHSETLNYVCGAYGILSLIQAASCRDVAGKKADVCTDLEENMRHELDKVRKTLEETYKAFEKCLSEGVEKSKSSCQKVLRSFLYPKGMKGGAFHKILKCLVESDGVHKPKNKKQMNLNVKLASYLTDSIDEEFKKTFPNQSKSGPFNGVICAFSLDTQRLIQKYKDVELQLIFLKTEEEKTKTELNKTIREVKKTIYRSLTSTIEETMKECYQNAAGFKGLGSLGNMRTAIEKHVHYSKDTMFDQAKDCMLKELRSLKEYILKTLEETMQKSIELSLKTVGDSIPDVTVELAKVKKYYDGLIVSPGEETLIW
ncbi:nuclear GTPase SLIP-GC-like [Chelmon rostratus]|uniref:nuclear GTPase SLIP-GC-like n=1 Tax=Chelmon rostratus TaxID=109905 RepID=UPI001BE544B8|nr:nuclear GTPase SLIP-GC-like [Chelmon rostratus]